MNDYVLDTSGLLAVWFGEAGADSVKAVLPRAAVGAVNLSEAYAKYVSRRDNLGAAQDEFAGSGLEVIPFDEALAVDAAALKAVHPRADLPFADRACLALAMREGAVALRSDKLWSSLAGVGQVEQFR